MIFNSLKLLSFVSGRKHLNTQNLFWKIYLSLRVIGWKSEMSFKNKLKRKFEEDVMSEFSWKLLLKHSNPVTEEQKRTIFSERAEERRSVQGNSI